MTHPIAERIAASVRTQTGDETSRRSFLNRTTLAGGALLALGGGTGLALAQEDDDDTETTASFDDVDGTDVDVLNFALTLEHLENAFYREVLETFSEDDFVNAESLQNFNEEFRVSLFSYVQTISEHEATHVDVLTQAVQLLGGEPVSEASYDFGVESFEDFLSLAQTFENTGVAAYAGAAPFIESPDLLSSALSIHSVEARHAAILNIVNGEAPFPNAFDPASSQQEVLDAVSPFIAEEEAETPDEEMPEETEAPPEETETPAEETGTPAGTPPEETETLTEPP